MIEGGKYQKKIKGLFFSEGRRVAKLGVLTAIFDMSWFFRSFNLLGSKVSARGVTTGSPICWIEFPAKYWIVRLTQHDITELFWSL